MTNVHLSRISSIVVLALACDLYKGLKYGGDQIEIMSVVIHGNNCTSKIKYLDFSHFPNSRDKKEHRQKLDLPLLFLSVNESALSFDSSRSACSSRTSNSKFSSRGGSGRSDLLLLLLLILRKRFP